MVDFEERRAKAATSMRSQGIDAMFVMKPTNLAYLTGDGRPCALGLLTSSGRFIVAVPECGSSPVSTSSAPTVLLGDPAPGTNPRHEVTSQSSSSAMSCKPPRIDRVRSAAETPGSPSVQSPGHTARVHTAP